MTEAHNTQSLARIFGVSPRAVRRWLRQGDIRSTKLGRSYYVDPDALKERLRGVGDVRHAARHDGRHGGAAEGR